MAQSIPKLDDTTGGFAKQHALLAKLREVIVAGIPSKIIGVV